MEIVVLDIQVLNYLTMRVGSRQRWSRWRMASHVRHALLPLIAAPCYLAVLRHLQGSGRVPDLTRIRELRRDTQIVFLTPPIFATIERLHAKYSRLDLYNVVSAAVALERRIPLAVWKEVQYAELRRHEGLRTVDWSK